MTNRVSFFISQKNAYHCHVLISVTFRFSNIIFIIVANVASTKIKRLNLIGPSHKTTCRLGEPA